MSGPREQTGVRRILLKLSGEALMGNQGFGISQDMLDYVRVEIAEAIDLGAQIGIVVGGGNFFRGVAGAAQNMDRVSGDQIGMLATAMNALAVAENLNRNDIGAAVLSSIQLGSFTEMFSRRLADHYLDSGKVVVFAAGTGNPFFTTDTAASLRAVEIGADVLLKATQVDGVYDSDPKTNPDAKRYDEIDFDEVLNRQLGVMDLTAITLCRENNMPVRVFALRSSGALGRILRGEQEGTLVTAAG
ncbi:MAG TPA: UMP kinase [Gammaproteobacteria bacterium]|nr:UMP kinase [Gammaproteobacteria bacterium]